MKANLLIAFLIGVFIANLSQAQDETVIVGSDYYQQLKAKGKLNDPVKTGYILLNPQKEKAASKPSTSYGSVKSSHCYGYTPPNPPATPQLAGIDDGCTGSIAIPFNFCFYGSTKNSFHINTNGSITFGSCYTTFTPTGFPVPGPEMIAPFWGDVDFANCGMCYYEIFPDAAIIHWVDAGYYQAHCDKQNSFQLIITDGNSSLLSPGSNVGFFYDNMDWTTGDASSGTNGFGGSPATVGINEGNGTDYIQIGRFDQPGTSYDGPFNANDGVDWLDNNYFMFDICGSTSGGSTNIPPIVSGLQFCDTLHICVGDTLELDVDFLSPESGQTTDASVDVFGVPGFSVTSITSGNTANAQIELIGQLNNIGPHEIEFTAWDDGTPADTIVFSITVEVDTLSIPPPVLIGPDTICPGDSAILVAGYNFDSYQWNFGSTDSIVQVAPGSYYFIAEHDNCRISSDTINVYANHPPVPEITGDTIICNNGTASLQTIAGFESYLWNTGDTSINITVTDSGYYGVTATDIYGCTGTDSVYITKYSFTIPNNNTICGLNYSVNGTQSAGGNWSVFSPNGYGSSIDTSGSILNPEITFDEEGQYFLIFQDNFCPEVDTVIINSIIDPGIELSDHELCQGEIVYLNPVMTGSQTGLNYFWSTNANTSSIPVSASGEYVLTVINQCGATSDTAFVDVFPCELNVPNLITADGNGYNDYLYIEALEYYDATLQIYNRWGNMVYESSDYQNDWDGVNMDGEKLTEGTYYYILLAKRKEKTEIRKGHIRVEHP